MISDTNADEIFNMSEDNHEDAVDFAIDCPTGYQVMDADTANWLVRRVVAARQYAARVEQFAAAELKRAQREEEHLIRRFGHQAEAWLRDTISAEGTRRRSVSLPAGRLCLRNQPAKLEVADASLIFNWARAHLPESLRVEINAIGAEALQLLEWGQASIPNLPIHTTVSKSDLRRHWMATGELPPGANVVAAHDRFRIE